MTANITVRQTWRPSCEGQLRFLSPSRSWSCGVLLLACSEGRTAGAVLAPFLLARAWAPGILPSFDAAGQLRTISETVTLPFSLLPTEGFPVMGRHAHVKGRRKGAPSRIKAGRPTGRILATHEK